MWTASQPLGDQRPRPRLRSAKLEPVRVSKPARSRCPRKYSWPPCSTDSTGNFVRHRVVARTDESSRASSFPKPSIVRVARSRPQPDSCGNRRASGPLSLPDRLRWNRRAPPSHRPMNPMSHWKRPESPPATVRQSSAASEQIPVPPIPTGYPSAFASHRRAVRAESFPDWTTVSAMSWSRETDRFGSWSGRPPVVGHDSRSQRTANHSLIRHSKHHSPRIVNSEADWSAGNRLRWTSVNRARPSGNRASQPVPAQTDRGPAERSSESRPPLPATKLPAWVHGCGASPIAHRHRTFAR